LATKETTSYPYLNMTDITLARNKCQQFFGGIGED